MVISDSDVALLDVPRTTISNSVPSDSPDWTTVAVTNLPGPKTWPITTFGFLVVDKVCLGSIVSNLN